LSGSARFFNPGAHFFHLDFILAQHGVYTPGKPCALWLKLPEAHKGTDRKGRWAKSQSARKFAPKLYDKDMRLSGML
jgi:hypothetical protein